MAKLHELLAVEGDLEKTSKKLIAESKKTFKKDNLFNSAVRTLEMDDINEQQWNTTERMELDTTVSEVLNYMNNEVTKYWDTVLQKDKTNQESTADIVLDSGTVLSTSVPVTFLLGLESKLKEYRSVLDAIPTLPPGIRWEKDPQEKEGSYIAKDDTVQFKTKNDIEFKVAYEATKEHPAQVKEIKTTKNVGTYTTIKHCSMLSPYEKARMISRHEKVLRAVKKARQRANNTDIKGGSIGESIFNYIMN